MKFLKTIGLAVAAATAFAAFAASSATATTLESGGVTVNEPVTISASLQANSVTVTNTSEGFYNTCSTSTMAGTTSVFTGARVTGALSTLTFENCVFGKVVVHQKGQIYIEHEAGTTAGNVFSENAELTVSSPVGTLTCKTGTGTKIGTLIGTTLEIKNAVINCGFFLPSSLWRGTYTLTEGLGVSA